MRNVAAPLHILNFCGLGLVERMFLRVWFMCPFAVSVVSGYYFVTFFSVSSGHPTKFPALIALSHVDLTGYPHTACIHLIACSVEGKSYTLFALSRTCFAFLLGRLGCHCPFCCNSGILYLPCSSLTPMSIGCPLHLISTSSSLSTVTPPLVKIDMVPSSAVLPTLMSDVGKSANESACVAMLDSCGMGRRVTYFALLDPPFATPTLLLDCFRMGKLAFLRSCSLR